MEQQHSQDCKWNAFKGTPYEREYQCAIYTDEGARYLYDGRKVCSYHFVEYIQGKTG